MLQFYDKYVLHAFNSVRKKIDPTIFFTEFNGFHFMYTHVRLSHTLSILPECILFIFLGGCGIGHGSYPNLYPGRRVNRRNEFQLLDISVAVGCVIKSHANRSDNQFCSLFLQVNPRQSISYQLFTWQVWKRLFLASHHGNVTVSPHPVCPGSG